MNQMSPRMNLPERRFRVCPSLPTKKHAFCRLCPSDLRLLQAEYIQKALIYQFPSGSPGDSQELFDSLEQKLADCLVYYYPLAGRLYSTNDDVIYIDCNDEGAEIIESSNLDASVQDILEEEVGPEVRKLFDLDGATDTQGLQLPLLVLKVTRLKDGIALAFIVNHAVVDGASLWDFVNSFAEICRGSSTLSRPPFHGRNFDIDGLPPISMKNLDRRPYSASEFSPPVIREKIFHFTKETILGLKRSANRNRKAEKQISSFQSLCAHIWQVILRAKGLGKGEQTVFMLPVNCRPRKHPALPPFYFGNAIQGLKVRATVEEVLYNDISHPADLLNRKISTYGNAEITEAVERYHEEPSVFRMNESINRDNRVWIGGSPRFPIYDADFGWGMPQGARSGWNNKMDGRLTAYPGREGEGSVDIEICLEASSMDAIVSDPLFRFHRQSSSLTVKLP